MPRQSVDPITIKAASPIGASVTASGSDPLAPSVTAEGVIVVRQLLAPAAAATLATELRERAASGGLRPDADIMNAWAASADLAFEGLLLRALPAIQQVAGGRLYPTYSYARVYERGAELPVHTDRDACEVSVSVTLGASSDARWPLFVAYGGRTFEAHLGPGDAVVYLGHACPHWREPLTEEWSAHAFLHYVFADGAFAHFRFDGR